MTRAYLFIALLVAVVLAGVALMQARAGAPAMKLPRSDWIDIWETYELSEIVIAPGFYTVQEGEQLFHVAMKHKLPGPVQLTVDVLRELNNLWDRPILQPGQRLKVPETDLSQWPMWAEKRWAKVED